MQSDDLRQAVVDTLMIHVNFTRPTHEKLGEDLLDLNIPEVDQWITQEVYPAFDSYLKAIIDRSIADFSGYKFRAWLTGTEGNYHLIRHNHSGSTISGTFYLLCEDSTSGGDLMLCDPRINANRGYSEVWQKEFDYTKIEPKTGDIYIFPSFLYHYVMPYAGRLRLCVPIDLYLYNNN